MTSTDGEQTVQPVATLPVSAAANLRRSVIVGAILGAASVVVTSVLGHPLLGVFGCVGLALGALNNRMLQRSVLQYGMDDTINKKQFRRGVLSRLGIVTVVAIAIGFFVQPDGLGVFVGLAVFQVLMLIGAAVPVLRSLRTTA
jgi:hypothetical protein